MPEMIGPETMPLTILTPAGTVFEGDVKEMTLRGPLGVFQVYPQHEPLLTPLAVSNMTVRFADDTKDTQLAVHGGFLQVTGSGATILADVAEMGSAIDPERARLALQRAQEHLEHRTDKSGIDMDREKMALLRAIARMNAVENKQV